MKLSLLNLSARFFLLLLVCISHSSFSQTLPTDYFRTRVDGNWQAANTWESSHDTTNAVNWITATNYPNELSQSILIQHAVTVGTGTVAVNADQIRISSSGSLTTSDKLTILNGPGIDIDCSGTLNLGKFMSGIEGVMRSGSQYIRILEKAIILTIFSWENGSTLKLTVTQNTLQNYIPLLSQSFGNIIWDGANQKEIFYLNTTSAFMVNGSFTITTPALKSLIFHNYSDVRNVDILGDLILKPNSTFILGNGAGVVTLNIGGNVTLEQTSNLIFTKNTTLNKINLAGNLNIGTSSFINQSTYDHTGLLTFTNENAQQFVSNSGTINRVKLILQPNVSVTINALELSQSVQAQIQNNASLIIGNVTGSIPANVERVIPPADWTQSMDGWHLLSSPVGNQTVSGCFTQGEYDFYAWNEVQNEWLNQKIGANNISSFVPGKGYLVSYLDGGTKTFTGNLNTASVNFTNLSFTGASPAAGFHLLGNPFPCSLDWNAAGWNRNGISSVAQVWNDEAGNYLPLGSDNGIIPAEQGFFVQAISGVNSITIPTQARVHANAPFNKQQPANFLRLRITDTVSGMYDETVVMLSSDASVDYDEFDGHKLVGSSNAPQLFTEIAAGERACVNALPSGSAPSALPLYFRKGTGVHYLLEAINNSMEREVWLEDKLTGVVTLLDSVPLSIDASSDYTGNRFVLHLGSLGIGEPDKMDYHVYSYSNTLYFTNISSNSNYGVFCLDGKMVINGKLKPCNLQSVDCSSLKPGVYIVRLNTGTATHCSKILIY